LPGPAKRTPKLDARMFGPESPRDHPASCRKERACGVDLGGELWGEHVYAVQDGVVDRVHREGNEDHGGISVRLSHFGGMVFTQYFHLAAIPRLLSRGDHIKAGHVIGLLGDTGTGGARRHLHFALSIRPSPELSEVYWDPTPLMAGWPLHTPAHGTVAGLAP
jgi:murein DD-endopeptidase MepM/ murein hydrolase activator NlpD